MTPPRLLGPDGRAIHRGDDTAGARHSDTGADLVRAVYAAGGRVAPVAPPLVTDAALDACFESFAVGPLIAMRDDLEAGVALVIIHNAHPDADLIARAAVDLGATVAFSPAAPTPPNVLVLDPEQEQ